MNAKDILVVGAGPTGLTAALHLVDKGIGVRIVEKRAEPSSHSKAFGVNPRTLTLHESTGVTERMLAQGFKMRAVNAWKKGKKLFQIQLSAVDHKYPFMLVHSQAESEVLMREALEERGVTVEREVELTYLTLQPGGAEATLSHADGKKETFKPPVVIKEVLKQFPRKQRERVAADLRFLYTCTNLKDAQWFLNVLTDRYSTTQLEPLLNAWKQLELYWQHKATCALLQRVCP